MGPPSHVPLPKSAFSLAVVPTLATHVADWACTGRPATSACQNESAGVVGQAGAPGTGVAWPGVARRRLAATARVATIVPARCVGAACARLSADGPGTLKVTVGRARGRPGGSEFKSPPPPAESRDTTAPTRPHPLGLISTAGRTGPMRPTRVTALFGTTAFVASGLLFVVEPLVARTMLPVLGGSASVWNSAMLTFQVLLLAGYLLAHLGATRLPPRVAPIAAAGLAVAAAALPRGAARRVVAPVGHARCCWTLLAVAHRGGGPFLALACVSPTLQRWYASVAPGVDPYVLYAAGNTGSFIGLLAYPLVVERALGIDAQRTWWTAGYLAFLVLFAACAVVARRAPAGPATGARP